MVYFFIICSASAMQSTVNTWVDTTTSVLGTTVDLRVIFAFLNNFHEVLEFANLSDPPPPAKLAKIKT